jgi:DNA-directed RNA polymerase subunit F
MEKVRRMGGRNDLWIVDSNFGMYGQDLETCKIIAECQNKYKWPENIQCDTGKNNKERVLNAAKLVNGAIRLSGAVQSLDKQVLINVKRSNISTDALMQMAVEAAEIDTSTKSDLILGLPGESLKTHFQSIKTVLDAGFSYIQTNQLMMLPGTELDDKKIRDQYQLKTKFRVLPRCFGHYEIDNEKIKAAEIEEICVSNNSLKFEDYIQSRKMHLLIHIFYNDGLFSTALKFLKDLDISIFRLMEIMHSNEMPEVVKELFSKFEEDTRNELWDSEEKLLEFIKKPGTIEKYISGEMGYNLLFMYKATAMNKCIADLKFFVLESIKQILQENQKNSKENIEFVSQILEFDLCCCSNIFHNKEKNPKKIFNYNIQSFQETKNLIDISNLKLLYPKEIEFTLDSEQENIINRSTNLYGTSDLGISRILTKVFFKKLLRYPSIDK